jgi:hypothetical protein
VTQSSEQDCNRSILCNTAEFGWHDVDGQISSAVTLLAKDLRSMAREAHAASLGVRNLAGSGAQPLLQNRNVDTYIQFNPIDQQHVRDTAGAARSTAVIRECLCPCHRCSASMLAECHVAPAVLLLLVCVGARACVCGRVSAVEWLCESLVVNIECILEFFDPLLTYMYIPKCITQHVDATFLAMAEQGLCTWQAQRSRSRSCDAKQWSNFSARSALPTTLKRCSMHVSSVRVLSFSFRLLTPISTTQFTSGWRRWQRFSSEFCPCFDSRFRRL